MVSANSFLSLMLRGFRASASVNSSVRQSSRGSSSRFAALSWSGGGVRAGKLALCTALLAAAAGAQSSVNWRIDTFAGLPDVRDNGPATDARLDFPLSVAVDGVGNLFIADRRNHRIRKVDSSGVITTIAGTGDSGFSGDGGPAVDAQLSSPYGVATDIDGNLYFAGLGNHRIRKVDSSGVITTIAGTGDSGFGGDGGPAVDAQLRSPHDVATDKRRQPLHRRYGKPADPQGGLRGGHHDHRRHGRGQVRRGRRPGGRCSAKYPHWRGDGQRRQPLLRRLRQPPDPQGGLLGGHHDHRGHGRAEGSAGTAARRSMLS